MATDWIKVEKTTPHKIEVLHIASMLKIHPDHAFGICFRFWSWCDSNMIDGNAAGVTFALLNLTLGVTGFAEAMSSAGWLATDGKSISVTNFENHLSQSAKSRGLASNRKRKHDAKVTPAALPERYDSVTKESAELELDNTKKRQRQKRTSFIQPTLDDVASYCASRGNQVDPEQWMSHYKANGWRVGSGSGKPMRDWKAAVITWEKNDFGTKPTTPKPASRLPTPEEDANWNPYADQDR